MKRPLFANLFWVALLFLFFLLTPGFALAELYLTEPPANWRTEEYLTWTVFDVNEGDAMLLTCGGETMLVDGGPDPFREQLRDALDGMGLRHLTYVLSTHYHDDHIDGLYRLFRYGFTAGEYLHSYSDKALAKNARGSRTVAAAQANGVPVRRVEPGERLALGQAEVQVFQCKTIENTNARSLLLKVSYGHSSLLLCADITGDAQHYFLETLPPDALDADLIKLPHHALNPVVTAFMDAVDPALAVATNCKGRASQAALDQLEYRGLPTFFSGEGRVCAVTDGTDWYVWQGEGAF